VVIRAVTLDAAGTLIEVAEPVGETYARVAAQHGIRVTPAAVERGFRAALAAAPPLAFPGASPVRLRDHERAWWYAIVRRAFGAAAVGAAFDATFDALFAFYADARAWRVAADVPAALATLRAHDLQLAVVSNFDARLGPLLDALGVARLVDAIVHSSAAGAAKPAPEIFRLALERLGTAADATLHVGDDPVADVHGARRAGLRSALIDRHGTASSVPGDVPRLRSLGELPQLLED
jgi:putative hydrolase of the HAD superfamily